MSERQMPSPVEPDATLNRYFAAFEAAHGPAKAKPDLTYERGWFVFREVRGWSMVVQRVRRKQINEMIGRLLKMGASLPRSASPVVTGGGR